MTFEIERLSKWLDDEIDSRRDAHSTQAAIEELMLTRVKSKIIAIEMEMLKEKMDDLIKVSSEALKE